MNFAKNRTLFPKMHKLGTSSLKQCAFLNGKRVLFSSRKIYEAGPMSGGGDLSPLGIPIGHWCCLELTQQRAQRCCNSPSSFRPHGFQVKKMEYERREETQTV